MGDQCVPAFAFMLFCVPEHAPSFSLRLSQVYPGGGCSVPELSHQSKHKCMSHGPEATWFSLCLFVSFSASTSVFQCVFFFRAHLFPIFHLVLKTIWNKSGVCADVKKPQLEQVISFLFFTASQLISKLISKPKIRHKTGTRSPLPVKHRLWNKRLLLSPNLFGLHTNPVLSSSMWTWSLKKSVTAWQKEALEFL